MGWHGGLCTPDQLDDDDHDEQVSVLLGGYVMNTCNPAILAHLGT